MKILGHLRKMHTGLCVPVQYSLPLDSQWIELNPLIGNTLELRHTGRIHCIHCGRLTRKSFNQGYCYPCFSRLAQCDACIVAPEKCHFDQGTCREPEWAQAHCMQPHVVYLANSSDIKVGITRQTQIPTRWMDQGAVAALPILQTSTRQVSGLLEVALKQFVSDRTQWQKMLKGESTTVDLAAKRDELLPQIGAQLDVLRTRFGKPSVRCLSQVEVEIRYPVESHPTKVTALNFDKTAVLGGVLQGIKGQYLIFDTGVLNVRKFGGYEVELTTA